MRQAAGGAPEGWITLVTKDGAEQATYLLPQPEAPEASNVEKEPVAAAEARGGALFVF